MSRGESVGGSRGGVSRSGETRSPGADLARIPDARSPGANGASALDARSRGAHAGGVPATLSRRTQNFGPGGAKSQGLLYAAHNLKPAFALHYDWTGWPTAGTNLPAQTAPVARETAPLWEKDGLRLLEPHATAEKVQILFSVTPQVSPTFFCQRVKGRLQHALRKCGTPVDFSRKVSFRSLGENTSDVVENYIRGQVGKGDFADPRFRETMRRFTIVQEDVRLAEPSESNSGRYWYDLHLVLVVADRFRITAIEQLARIRDAVLTVATEGGHRIAALSVMPDHVHMALRGNIELSPEEIALAFQNGLARAAGCRVWQDGFYVGTFSEYDLDVIRRIARQS
jgi:REP element-mobilizing transposase RayT